MYHIHKSLEVREKSGRSFLMKKLGEKSGKNEIVFSNVLESIDIAHFIFIFFQRIRVINVTLCYTPDNRKNIVSLEKSGKIKNVTINGQPDQYIYMYCK